MELLISKSNWVEIFFPLIQPFPANSGNIFLPVSMAKSQMRYNRIMDSPKVALSFLNPNQVRLGTLKGDLLGDSLIYRL